MFEFESLGTDGAFVDAGEGFEKFATPFIDVLESNVAFERMDDCFHKVDAFLRVWQLRLEHLTFPHLTCLTPWSHFADILLNHLQLLRSNGQPALVDWAADVVDEAGVLAWTRHFKVDEIFCLFGVLGLKNDREYSIVFELILNAAAGN